MFQNSSPQNEIQLRPKPWARAHSVLIRTHQVGHLQSATAHRVQVLGCTGKPTLWYSNMAGWKISYE